MNISFYLFRKNDMKLKQNIQGGYLFRKNDMKLKQTIHRGRLQAT